MLVEKLKNIIVVILLSISFACFGAERISVTFLSPGGPDKGFFAPAIKYMEVAAENLNIDLSVVYAHRSYVKLLANARKIFKADSKPDYLIVTDSKGVVPIIIEEADRHGIKTVLFNEALPEKTFKEFTTGETKLQNFIGQVIPDDESAGYLLGKELIKQARTLNPDKEIINVIGLTGTHNTISSDKREIGLKLAISEIPYARLLQVVRANWIKEQAKIVTQGLVNRYKDIQVVWAASDDMASGARQGLMNSTPIDQAKVVTGGIDWAPVVFDGAIQSGEINASAGGHITDGYWIMVAIYDHFFGMHNKFININTKFSIITKDNYDKYQQVITPEFWKTIDVKKFTKRFTNRKSNYRFGVGAVLK